MKRAAMLPLALSIVLGTIAPASSARPAQRFELEDCKESRAEFPIQREEARALLPDGFEPAGGPAGGQALVWFDLLAITCGDGDAPRFDAVIAYLSVEPPRGHRGAASSFRFILDAVAVGPSVAGLERHLCAGDLFDTGTVQGSYANYDAGTDEARSTLSYTYVSSSSLKAQIVVEAASPNTAADEPFVNRWFYDDGSKVRTFDSHIWSTFVSLGESTVAFGEETDLAIATEPKGGGLGMYAESEETFIRPQDCR